MPRSPLWMPLTAMWILMLLTFSISKEMPGGSTLDALLSKVKFGMRGIAIVAFLIALRMNWERRKAWPILLAFTPLAFFVGWAFLSTVWSPLKLITLAQAGSLLCLFLLAANFAMKCQSQAETVRLVRHLCAALLVIATGLIFLSMIYPPLQVMQRSGTGLFHATNTAATASLGLVLTVSARLIWKARWAGLLLVPAMPIYFTVLYLSANRLAFALAVIFIAVLLMCYCNRAVIVACLFCGCVLGSIYLTVDPGLDAVELTTNGIVAYTRRDQSLEELSAFSGREEMWDVMWDSFWESPWWGHGYFVTSSTGSLEVWYKEGNFSAHNLLLQVLVTTGIFGAVLFMWGLCQAFAYALWRTIFRANTQGLTGFLIVITAWYFAWGLLNESFMGPVQPESVAFFSILGMAVGRAASGNNVFDTDGQFGLAVTKTHTTGMV